LEQKSTCGALHWSQILEDSGISTLHFTHFTIITPIPYLSYFDGRKKIPVNIKEGTMNNLITVSGVKGYIDENGIAQLNLEDVARGLGFTQIAASGNEVIRWERVNKHLEEFGFIPTSGDGRYIPENIFYRLSMKASNQTAVAFQTIVADEILPSIRKTGSYSLQPKDSYMITDPIERAKAWIVEAEQTKTLTLQLEAQHPKVIFADSVSVSNTSILIGELAKIIKGNGVDIGEKRFFEWLRNNKYLICRKGTDYNAPTQKSMDLSLFRVKETVITHSDGHISINKTTKVTGKGQIYFVNKFKTELMCCSPVVGKWN